MAISQQRLRCTAGTRRTLPLSGTQSATWRWRWKHADNRLAARSPTRTAGLLAGRSHAGAEQPDASGHRNCSRPREAEGQARKRRADDQRADSDSGASSSPKLTGLWPDLASGFPHTPDRQLGTIEDPLARLHVFRNRLAHHQRVVEPRAQRALRRPPRPRPATSTRPYRAGWQPPAGSRRRSAPSRDGSTTVKNASQNPLQIRRWCGRL